MGVAGSFARIGASAWIALVAAVVPAPGATLDGRAVVRAAEDLVAGRPHVALADATRLGDGVPPPWRDEVALVAGLAGAASGREEEALAALGAVLASEPPSPHHALALAAALDLGREPRLRGTAAALATRHLPRLGAEPTPRRTRREAAILGAFLRTGRILLEPAPLELTPDRPLPAERCAGPAEAAVHRAALLALEQGDAAGAGALFEALAPESPYFAYAQHGIARVRLSLGDEGGTAAALGRLRAAADARGAEGPLRDRASILWAELARREGDADGAVRRLEGVDPAGAFAAAARHDAAAILLDAGDPSRALAHLAGAGAASARLEGRHALLEAEARTALGDRPGAVNALGRGRAALAAAIDELATAPPARIAALRDALAARAGGRPERPWQSGRLPAALAALARDDLAPSGFALQVAAWTGGVDPLPPFVPNPWDRHAVCGAPAVEPPADPLFPAAFRRLDSLEAERALAALVHLRAAREREDERELALALGVREAQAHEAARREAARLEHALDERIADALAAEAADLRRLVATLDHALARALLAPAGGETLRTSARTSDRRVPSPPR